MLLVTYEYLQLVAADVGKLSPFTAVDFDELILLKRSSKELLLLSLPSSLPSDILDIFWNNCDVSRLQSNLILFSSWKISISAFSMLWKQRIFVKFFKLPLPSVCWVIFFYRFLVSSPDPLLLKFWCLNVLTKLNEHLFRKERLLKLHACNIKINKLKLINFNNIKLLVKDVLFWYGMQFQDRTIDLNAEKRT